MPTFPFRWLVPFALLFLVSLGCDRWLAHSLPATPGGAVAEAETLSATDFLAAAQAGTLRDGRIIYRPQVPGLAELRATRGEAAGAGLVQTTMRLTDAEVSLLRKQRFAEGDAVTFARLTVATPHERGVRVARVSTQVSALLLGVAGCIAIGQRILARHTAFAAGTLRSAASAVKFSSVAGCDEAKDEVHEVVEFLRDPARFTTTGGRMPKGVLLVGPPGTGKTMLAQAVAGEAQAHFYSLSGSDFVELYVGVGASRVRSLFKKARETAPSIIFIDEIDAIGRHRSAGGSNGAQQEHDQTLNALLVALDGFASDDAVVVFGATNRPDALDPALLRAGRFDRQVQVGLPDLAGRHAILQVHAGAVKLDVSVDLHEVAKTTSGYSGAELANLLNEGAIHAARRRARTILMSDLAEARDKLNWGRETRRALSPQDKRVIASHEAGHALMQLLAGDDAMRLQKVTIIPRGRSLGSTHFTPERDLFNHSREQLLARLQCLMAGRVAEELMLGTITSGASGDIQQATRIARQMVFEWGMSPLGFMALTDAEGRERQSSELTFHQAEAHVKSLLDENYATTTAALRDHRAALEAIAAELIARETISGEEVRVLLDAHPTSARPTAPAMLATPASEALLCEEAGASAPTSAPPELATTAELQPAALTSASIPRRRGCCGKCAQRPMVL